ncbi:MAG: hypothetical protein IJE07_03935 [Clostridia bacterium]|nr:hypothetical protein [Clostridia bacterium]
MPMRTIAVHMPALSRQEAAMLAAQERGEPVDNRCGATMAGRALLTHVKNAPARRRRTKHQRAKSCVT